MPYRLEKESVHKVPVGAKRIINFQIGYLRARSSQDNGFRYTRSLELIRGSYRITLQIDPAVSTPTPYVFDVIRSTLTGMLEISPDNGPAREAWNSAESPLRSDFLAALDFIFRNDIEVG